jgi:hypothetical protein
MRTCIPPPAIDCAYHYEAPVGAICDPVSQKIIKNLVIDTPASNEGKACPTERTKTESCSNFASDCYVTAWKNVGQCVGGVQNQERTVTLATNGGLACTAAQSATTQQVSCQIAQIAVDCAGTYGQPGPCTLQPDGTYASTEVFTATRQPQNGGRACSTNRITPCQPVDCAGTYGQPSQCTLQPDGTYASTEVFNATRQPQNGGRACSTNRITPCQPVDCQVSSWDAGTCDQATRTLTQTRTVTRSPRNGGALCPALTQTTPGCGVPNTDCAITYTCNPDGTYTTYQTASQSGTGAACPPPPNCPVDCQVSSWDAGTCDQATRNLIQTRTVTRSPLYGGQACPALTQTTPGCVPNIDCAITYTCNPDGTYTTYQTASQSGTGAACPPPPNCPVDCVVDDRCVLGTKTRNVITPASNGGTACPKLTQNCQLPTCIPCQSIFAPNNSNLTLNDKFIFSVNVPISFLITASAPGMLLNIMQPLFADALGINWTNVNPVIFQEASTSNTSDLILCIYGDSTYIQNAIELQVDDTGEGVDPSLFSFYGLSTVTNSLAGQPFLSGWPIQDMYNYYLGNQFPGQIYYITH